MQLMPRILAYSLFLTILWTPSAEADTLLHLTAADSTALEEIKALIEDGKYADAEAQARELLAKVEAEHGAESLEAVKVLDQLVEALWRGGKANESETQQLAERAVEIKEKLLGLEHVGVATSVKNLGAVFSYQADYNESELLFKRALAIRENALGPEHLDVASILHNLANVYSKQSKYARAVSLYVRSLAIREENLGRDHLSVAQSLNNLASAQRHLGKYVEAESHHKRSLAIREKSLGSDHPKVAQSLNNLGNLYWEQGKYSEAEPLYRRSLAIREKMLGSGHLKVAQSLHNLAILYSELGDYVRAELYYNQALSIKKKALGSDHMSVAYTYTSLGVNFLMQGKYGDAERLFNQALDIIVQAGGQYHLYASNLENLAILNKQQDKYAEAETFYKQALTIMENTLGSNHPRVAKTMMNFANLFRSKGDYTESALLYQRALEVAQKALQPDHHVLAKILATYSKLLRLQGTAKSALSMALRATNIRRNNFFDNAPILTEKEALTYSQFMRISLDNYLSCYVDLTPGDSQTINTAANIILSTKGQVSDGIFERQNAVVKETDSTTLALAESLRFNKFQLSKLFVAGPGDDVEAYRNEVDSLAKLANGLEADLSRYSVGFRRHQDVQDISSDRIVSLLPENSVLLEYLKYDYLRLNHDTAIPHYLVVTIDRSNHPTVVDLGEAAPTDDLIRAYRKHMDRIATQGHLPTAEDKAEYERTAAKIYAAVIEPVEQHVEGKDLVFVAPDGGLNLISFAGLIGDDGRYLVERFLIHHLSAGRDLIRLKYQDGSGSGLLAMGDPDFDATIAARVGADTAALYATANDTDFYRTHNMRSGCGDLRELEVSALPSTRSEVHRIADAWTSRSAAPASVYTGALASEDVFKSNAPGKRVIHLATHGYYLEGSCNPVQRSAGFEIEESFVGENPLLLSGLLFAGSNLHGEGADSTGIEDGVLSAYEVTAMDLSGVDLVVLSACETGLGKVEEGEGVYGLRRAFQLAGVRTVVSALWPVADEQTAEMMSELYAESDKPIPERLRDMQISQIDRLRSQGISDHPFNWAAFIAIGDWR